MIMQTQQQQAGGAGGAGGTLKGLSYINNKNKRDD